MLESVLGGLVLALVGSLTFVAYRHPDAYRQWQPFLTMLGGLGLGCASGYLTGVTRAGSAIYSYDTKSVDEPILLREIYTLIIAEQTYGWWGMGIAIVIILYLLFLRELPRMGITHKGKSD